MKIEIISVLYRLVRKAQKQVPHRDAVLEVAESRYNLHMDHCKNSKNFVKVPEVLFPVNFVASDVALHFLMVPDLADPYFLCFRSYSANLMYLS